MVNENTLAAMRARVAMTRMLVDAGREKASKLADLICELEAMEGPINTGGHIDSSPNLVKDNIPMKGDLAPEKVVKMPNYLSVPINVLMAKKAELLKEIDALRKQEGRRANALAAIDDEVDAADQCEQLVLGRLEIERLYDDYYFMERTGQLPNTVPSEAEPEDPEIELKKYRLDQAIKSAKNILYKAEQKMKHLASYSKKNRATIIEDTQDKINRYEAEVERLEVERKLL